MTTLTNGTATITPALVLGWETHRTSRTVLHDVLSRSDPEVVLRPSATRAGTLRLFFLTPEEAHECEQMHAAPAVWDAYTGGLPTEVARNLAINPRPASGTGWAGSAGTGAATTVLLLPSAPDGPEGRTGYRRMTWTTAATGGTAGPYFRADGTIPDGRAGDVLPCSMWVRPSVAVTWRLQVSTRKAGASVGTALAGTPVDCPSGQWSRLAETLTATADYDGVQVWASTPAAPLGTATVDHGSVVIGHDLGYSDGDVSPDPALVPSWLGDPGLSASVLTYTPPSPAPGGTMRYVVAGGDLRVTSDGPDHARWVVEVPFREVAL